MAIFLNSYKFSNGAFNVKAALVEKGHRVLVSNKAPKDSTALIVSWGNSSFEYDPARYRNVVNHPAVIRYLSNKLAFFTRVGHSDLVPEWATEAADALKWEGKVFVRHKLEGSGGAGIEILDRKENPGIEIPQAPLYVRHFPKTHEFRVHMARSLRGGDFTPLLVQRKIFQKTPENPAPRDWNIRNHENGFVYVRESNFPTPQTVVDAAKAVMERHFKEAHFAALDVLYHDKRKQAVVLEGNTAPGLEGNTVQVYADYFHQLEKESHA